MKKTYLILLIIFILGAFIRFFLLAQIPASLNQDETAIGYNAYSILKTGHDEHGVFMPITYESFGDWKLILYPLIDTIPILLFGLNEFAVRFPSAFFGSLQVVLIFFLAQQLFKNKKISLISAFMMAMSPWSIYFSRMAYEVNVGNFLFMSATLLLLKFIDSKKSWLLITASILFGLTLITYHAFIIFTPIFVLGIFIIFAKTLFKNKLSLSLSILIFIIFCLVSFSNIFLKNGAKLSDNAVWADQNTYYNRVDILRTDGAHDPKILNKLIYNKFTAVAYQIGQNYLLTFSPTFLFDKGGTKLLHNLGYFGNMYFIDVIFLGFGIFGIIYTKQKNLKVIILWILLAAVPGAVTSDVPSSTRAYPLLPVLLLIASFGFIYMFDVLKNNIGKILIGLILIIYLWNILFFVDGYFIHINYQRAAYLHYGYKQIVEVAKKYPNDKVIVTGPDNFPYISFLFYTKFDPSTFQKEVVYYPQGTYKFDDVKSFDRYEFIPSINYTNLQKNTLYFDTNGINPNVDYTINLPNGDPVFKYFFGNR